MSDEASAFQTLVNLASTMYAEHKTILAFIGGAITFGVPHGYKLYKFFADRKDLKDKIYEELIDEAHKNRALVQNAANILAEMILKAKSGLYWGDGGGAVFLYLDKVERGVVRPAVDAAEEFYTAVCDSNSLSLRKLRGYRVRAKKIKHANELALSGMQARLREYGVLGKFVGKVE
ncbi:hypothetical protein AWM79_21720 [Pseudomonas agarici]|uniref:Uncharacterized protein n=1 Tax=Pseudomonas agarici TaxID=46677 RepID=A0A0X1T6M0_PSEAA|nr:hypothetical protein [Pseudomonas agarici]AMB87757.1 hypothetical protein AWM79_21720 [Pseudomonas agarici]